MLWPPATTLTSCSLPSLLTSVLASILVLRHAGLKVLKDAVPSPWCALPSDMHMAWSLTSLRFPVHCRALSDAFLTTLFRSAVPPHYLQHCPFTPSLLSFFSIAFVINLPYKCFTYLFIVWLPSLDYKLYRSKDFCSWM